jgi:glucose/arabinose dehydrogenase
MGFRGMVFLGLAASLLSGCYIMRPSQGGGEIGAVEQRGVKARDIALPEGYVIEPIATELIYPTGVTFDAQGRVYVVESGYSYGESWTIPRLLRIEGDGKKTQIAAGDTNGPWTGVTFHDGAFYVAEGGVLGGGQILRITPDGRMTAIVSGLPSMGDHHSNGPIMGRDGWLYFAQGTASNSGVIGEDNAQFGWLARYPQFHDIPGQDIRLRGQNFVSGNPLTSNKADRVVTGAFLPFGTPSEPGQVISGKVPCSGSVMRVRPEGGKVELVAWGFRNPFGLAFGVDDRLFVTENGYDVRGSRPVWGTPDVLWHVSAGTWYGWPDYSAGMPLDQEWFKETGKPQPEFLLAEHPNRPPSPVARFAVHASANGLDFSRNRDFGYVGQAFVALFGDQAPAVGKVLHPVGFQVVRVNIEDGTIEPFATNQGRKNGPASRLRTGGLERPVAARFDRAGAALYVVDFGVLRQTKKKSYPQGGTGVLWRITKRTTTS